MMDLFTGEAVFLFHSRSKDAPPGRGVGEEIHVPDETYSELARHRDWRRKLSNFAESPFTMDGLTWRSVEHAFQAAKFMTVDPGYYRSFSIESGSALGAALGAEVRSAGGKRGRPLGPADLAHWEKVKHDVMARALYAKFSQNEASRIILLATGLAKLTHRPLRAAHTQVEMGMMDVRRRLREAR
ncbi:Hypothetical protein A7982_11841 [Minicystis rosea]|nr:Hypothetical protein A7982_11841 [Minicystis rosea]